MTSGHASLLSSNSRGTGYLGWTLEIVCCALALVVCPVQAASFVVSGCADGTREGLHGSENTAACEGAWAGHITNANSLCAPGWRVCTSFDVQILRNITWLEAQRVPGCLAYNAAQDGGRCRECRGDLEHDDLAGIGYQCPHQTAGQSSCITGGRIDSSCCTDSHFNTACHFKPGVMTGVICCRLPAKKPNIVVKPPERHRVYKDLIIILTCQASGMPPPRVQWYKDGRTLSPGNGRISILSSGELLVTLARKSDTGLYTCEAINEEGIDTASSFVQVAEYTSGCADGTTDGLQMHRDIQACQGAWEGHVRLGKSLCTKGWRVCSPRDQRSLQELTTYELFDLPGCYGYNAASRRNRCKSCKASKMAGVGKDCGWVNYAHSSCLSYGRVDVFPLNVTSSCDYTPGLTTGVLCCRKSLKDRKLKCSPTCKNGGECLAFNKCSCKPGYKGARCQLPICEPACGVKGVCVSPNTCLCNAGYTGPACRQKEHSCRTPCLNGGRCHLGKCKCPEDFHGKACQFGIFTGRS
ncbi:neurogenic locus notch homolog protein 1-like [Physella acuta]|uniref:neurogenic locus notch homolog protein 1-like n=1 Tax=Physella acuta TaxID=109671 RepID=UPI0027DB61F2|nr:neurogenic locus notch homolog protein 1-like [Physella acuta]